MIDASKAQKVRSPNLATVRVIAKSHNYRKNIPLRGKKVIVQPDEQGQHCSLVRAKIKPEPHLGIKYKRFFAPSHWILSEPGGNFSRSSSSSSSSSSIKWPGHYGQECRFKRGKVILSLHKIKKRVPIETRTCLATIHETIDKARSHFGHSKK